MNDEKKEIITNQKDSMLAMCNICGILEVSELVEDFSDIERRTYNHSINRGHSTRTTRFVDVFNNIADES